MIMDYCKGQMRTHTRKAYRGSISGLVTVYVYVCPVCRAEYRSEEVKPDFITLKCSEMAQEREEIAA